MGCREWRGKVGLDSTSPSLIVPEEKDSTWIIISLEWASSFLTLCGVVGKVYCFGQDCFNACSWKQRPFLCFQTYLYSEDGYFLSACQFMSNLRFSLERNIYTSVFVSVTVSVLHTFEVQWAIFVFAETCMDSAFHGLWQLSCGVGEGNGVGGGRENK